MSVPPEQARELPWHVSERLLPGSSTGGAAPAAAPARKAATKRPSVRQVVRGRWLVARAKRERKRWLSRQASGAARRTAVPDELKVDVAVVGNGPAALVAAGRARGTAPELDLSRVQPAISVRDREAWLGDAWLPLHVPQLISPAGFPQAADGPVVRLSSLSGARLSPWARRDLVATLRHRQGVDVTESPLTPVETARLVVDLAGAGAVVVARRLSPELAALLGDELASAVVDGSRVRLVVPAERERQSVVLRRAVHRHLSQYAGLAAVARSQGIEAHDVPTVSVLMSTNRPSMVEFAVDQVSRQDYPRLEMLCGLHGFSLDDEASERLRAKVPGLHLLEHGTDLDLGQVLASLGARASGELVTKWDDDDWYTRDHLRDLVSALRYSGAGMVGKAAEFVHLTSLGVTMRRFPTGAESVSTRLAGGTLMLRAATLREVGGWPAGPKRVDRLLIDALAAKGLDSYRMHGFGYLLRRDSQPGRHTWQVEDDYFLKDAVDQRPGLDLAFAGVEQ